MSLGEAEFYGAVKGASAGSGMKALYRDIGYRLPLRLWTDSSAVVGICSRQGLGKLRHLGCTSLWIQQRIRHGDLEARKIAGEVNPADLYTKHLESKAKIEQLRSDSLVESSRVGEPRPHRSCARILPSPAWSRRLSAQMRTPLHFMTTEEMNDGRYRQD